MKEKVIITMILALAFFLRVYHLGGNPPHLTADEASLGYNAYSILKTGRDEYGQILPIIFKSFGDYKPGLYVYLTVPFIALLGLTEFATRLPSAIAGTIAVWLVYKIVQELRLQKKINIGNGKLEMFASFILALTPWHIFYSRGAWEANISLTLTLAGIYFFFKALKTISYLPISVFFFSLTLWAYQGAKLSTLIVMVLLTVIFRERLYELYVRTKPGFARSVVSVVIGIIISLPIFLSLFQGRTGRLEVFSVFSYPRPQEYVANILTQGDEQTNSPSYFLFHSETLSLGRGVAGRWFNHFSGKFLFFQGDYQNPRHQIPYQGQLLLITIVPLLFGFIWSVRNLNKTTLFFLLWLILTPLPAALSRDQVQATRAFNMVIPLVVLITFGLTQLQTFYKTHLFKKIFLSSLVLLFVANFIYYWDAHFVHLPIHNAKHWSYGYKQMVLAINSQSKEYDRVVVEQSYAQPYIYFMFYRAYDPSLYQKEAKLVGEGLDVGLVEKLGNIEFRKMSWPPAYNPNETTLFVGSPVAIPPDFSQSEFNLIKEIIFPNGEIAFRMIDLKNR